MVVRAASCNIWTNTQAYSYENIFLSKVTKKLKKKKHSNLTFAMVMWPLNKK